MSGSTRSCSGRCSSRWRPWSCGCNHARPVIRTDANTARRLLALRAAGVAPAAPRYRGPNALGLSRAVHALRAARHVPGPTLNRSAAAKPASRDSRSSTGVASIFHPAPHIERRLFLPAHRADALPTSVRTAWRRPSQPSLHARRPQECGIAAFKCPLQVLRAYGTTPRTATSAPLLYLTPRLPPVGGRAGLSTLRVTPGAWLRPPPGAPTLR